MTDLNGTTFAFVCSKELAYAMSTTYSNQITCLGSKTILALSAKTCVNFPGFWKPLDKYMGFDKSSTQKM